MLHINVITYILLSESYHITLRNNIISLLLLERFRRLVLPQPMTQVARATSFWLYDSGLRRKKARNLFDLVDFGGSLLKREVKQVRPKSIQLIFASRRASKVNHCGVMRHWCQDTWQRRVYAMWGYSKRARPPPYGPPLQG